MRELRSNPDYIHYSPVFLDATCSGVQHFAAMLLDEDLAQQVNLINNEDGNEKVNDFYTSLLPHINKAINEKWINEKINKQNIKTDLTCFKDIELKRSHLKSIIMTKNYNVTTFGISGQLKSNFEKVKKTITTKNGKELVVYDYKVPAKNKEGMVVLDIFQLQSLATIINNNIFDQYTSLQEIFNYLTQMAKVLISQNIPLTWYTPTGLVVTQHYNLSKKQRVTINLLGKNRTAVLRKWFDKLDSRKQIQGIIPNIVHSMDASHLFKVVEEWSLIQNKQYILPIHDCFGTHPNQMLNLTNIVRNQFIELYANQDFLEKLHNKFLNDIKDYKIEVINKDGVDYVKRKNVKYKIPKLPRLGNLIIKNINGKYNIS